MFRLEQLLRKGWASQLRMSCHADGTAGHIDTLTSSWSPDNDSKFSDLLKNYIYSSVLPPSLMV